MKYIIVLVLAIFSANIASAVDTEITIGTGTITGIYYPAGGSICRLLNKYSKDYHLRCTVKATNGSVSNLEDLEAGKYDFAIVQSDQLHFFYNGLRNFTDKGPNKSVRAVFSLHNDVLTLITRVNSKIKHYGDLKNHKIYDGWEGSGTRALFQVLIDTEGWNPDNFPLTNNVKQGEQAEALCSNKIDGALFAAGHPNGTIQDITTSCESIILPINGDEIGRMIKQNPYYNNMIIFGNLYPGNLNNIESFGTKAVLITLEGTSELAVYQLVKSVFENFDRFKKFHPVFASLDMKGMVSQAITIPMHKGAEKYFIEKGLIKGDN